MMRSMEPNKIVLEMSQELDENSYGWKLSKNYILLCASYTFRRPLISGDWRRANCGSGLLKWLKWRGYPVLPWPSKTVSKITANLENCQEQTENKRGSPGLRHRPRPPLPSGEGAGDFRDYLFPWGTSLQPWSSSSFLPSLWRGERWSCRNKCKHKSIYMLICCV